MIDTKIERVARAIAWSRIDGFERAFLLNGGVTEATFSSWEWCVPDARAAIKAANAADSGGTTPGSMQAEADPGGLVERNGRQ